MHSHELVYIDEVKAVPKQLERVECETMLRYDLIGLT